MKKFFMTLAVVMIAVCANAQVYLGGNVGIASVDYGGDDDETIYSLLPEIGYKFNDNWAAGVMFGWSKAGLQIDNGEFATSERLTTHTFEISPYARYTSCTANLSTYSAKVVSDTSTTTELTTYCL